METTIELVDLWFLDGNYNEPVKTKGFRAAVKMYHYECEKQGYIFICPKSGAFMIGDSYNLFDSEKSALLELARQQANHKKYLQRQVEKYIKELKEFKQ